MTTIELRQSLLSRTRGAIELTADRLIISMPSYLDELAWQVPLDGASFQVVDAGGARAALTSTRRWQRIQYWTAPALLMVACVSGVPADLVARGVEAAGVAGFVGFKLLRKFRAPAALTLD